jgi:hypothetical protein
MHGEVKMLRGEDGETFIRVEKEGVERKYWIGNDSSLINDFFNKYDKSNKWMNNARGGAFDLPWPLFDAQRPSVG